MRFNQFQDTMTQIVKLDWKNFDLFQKRDPAMLRGMIDLYVYDTMCPTASLWKHICDTAPYELKGMKIKMAAYLGWHSAMHERLTKWVYTSCNS